ncbi:MAG: TrkH family potassium uptake protein [Bacillota bacterium]
MFTPQRILLLGFGLLIAIGTFLLSLPAAVNPGGDNSFLTALFTATSATCVVGLAVVDTGTNWSPFGQAVILGLIQVGGLGFITVATLILILVGRKINLRQRLLIQESLNQFRVGGVVRLVIQVITITLAFQAVAAAVLAVRLVPDFGWGPGVWMSVFHSVAAFNNAGFDLFGGFRSLTAYTEDVIINLGVGVPVIIGGLGFVVIVEVIQKRSFRKLSLHSAIVLTTSFFLLVLGFLVILAIENTRAFVDLSAPGKVLASFFQSLTTRTAGFNTVDIGALHPATQFFMIGLMFIGGGSNSVAGGIKVTAFALLLLATWNLSRGRGSVRIWGREIPQILFQKAVALAIIQFAVLFLATLVLSITERADFLTILFEVTSALSLVGLSMGLTPDLSPAGKLVLTVCMYIGRVGPLTLVFALVKPHREPRLKYPDEQILIG